MHDIFYINNLKDDTYHKLREKFFTLKFATSVFSAQEKASTKFFYTVYSDVVVDNSFLFNYIPDNFSQEYPHIFLNGDCYDGIALLPKNYPLSKNEVEYRFFVRKKEVPIIASTPRSYEIFTIDTMEQYEHALENSKTEMFFGVSSMVDIIDMPDVYFRVSKAEEYNRKENHAWLNDVCGELKYDGLYLFSKHKQVSKKEIEYRHLVHKKEYKIVASRASKYPIFTIETYDDYLYALENSKTEMFWGTTHNINTDCFDFDLYYNYRGNEFEYERRENHAFIHRVGNKDYYNGLFLFSKHKPVTEKEIKYRHLVSKKEHEVVASTARKYEIFTIETYDDYLYALENSKTEMFWIIPNNINISDKFKFDLYFTHDDEYNRKINHLFLNGSYYDGVVLCSKYAEISKRELEHRFISHKKEHNKVASIPNSYDIIFISYNEPNADKNYEDLLKMVPYAKRVHGVKGIHQAHIAAANKSDTDMFFVVDGDARILDSFSFDYQVAHWNSNTVHVWHSINPINGLVYGYGGVKLLPKNLTLNMNINSVDMTTSISKNFKVIDKISNVTAFDTDPFNTWKSAFRECAKLASKIINRQDNAETEANLKIWTSVGEYKEFGEYAIKGAKAGKEFGFSNKSDLSLINDFEWLERKFKEG